MKIGIVIHTNSGHTLAFAQSIRGKLEARGHEVDILGLRTIGRPSPFPSILPVGGGGGKFTIKSPPELDEYDAVLAGGPVWAFKASPVIMRFLNEDVKTLKGKKALSFVCMGLPPRFGGDRALRMMNEELEIMGANVLEGEKLRYLFKVNAAEMDAAAERVCGRITA